VSFCGKQPREQLKIFRRDGALFPDVQAEWQTTEIYNKVEAENFPGANFLAS